METALRMNARRIMMGELRGENDMRAFLECVSNGIPIMTTTHTSEARNFPDRGVNMLGGVDADRVANSLYNYVDITVLLKLKADVDGKIYRYIDQVCFLSRENNKNQEIGTSKEYTNFEECKIASETFICFILRKPVKDKNSKYIKFEQYKDDKNCWHYRYVCADDTGQPVFYQRYVGNKNSMRNGGRRSKNIYHNPRLSA